MVWDIFDFNPSFDLKSSGASEALEPLSIFAPLEFQTFSSRANEVADILFELPKLPNTDFEHLINWMLKHLINSTIIDYIEQMIEVRQIEKDIINFQEFLLYQITIIFALSDQNKNFNFPKNVHLFQIIVA